MRESRVENSTLCPMPAVPLLTGSHLALERLPEGARTVVAPRRPPGIASVEAAVQEAVRFPLSGPALAELVTAGARVTILLEAARLPLPPPRVDPRREALAALVDELDLLGVPPQRQTILVAGGLGRRPGRHELELRLGPSLARRFEGQVVAHDAEDPALETVLEYAGWPVQVARPLVESDLVLVLGAAETVTGSGAGALLDAADARSLRAWQDGESLLLASGERWNVSLALERALARRVSLLGVSLALGQPRARGTVGALLRRRSGWQPSLGRRAFNLLPPPARRALLRELRMETGASAVFAGPPSVAHTEALLHAVELRAAALDRPVDTLVLGLPPYDPHAPFERANPLSAAYLALGLTLRLWRGEPPVRAGGTLILLHRLHRRFAHPTQTPHRLFFSQLRERAEADSAALTEREQAALDERALEEYRAGRSCHPLLPFAEWAACAAPRARLRDVLVAGCRDAAAARALGFVPVHSLQAALEIARETQGDGSVAAIPTPPFFPIRVGE